MNYSRDSAWGTKHVPALISTQVQNMSKLIFAFENSHSEFSFQRKLN